MNIWEKNQFGNITNTNNDHMDMKSAEERWNSKNNMT